MFDFGKFTIINQWNAVLNRWMPAEMIYFVNHDNGSVGEIRRETYNPEIHEHVIRLMALEEIRNTMPPEQYNQLVGNTAAMEPFVLNWVQMQLESNNIKMVNSAERNIVSNLNGTYNYIQAQMGRQMPITSQMMASNTLASSWNSLFQEAGFNMTPNQYSLYLNMLNPSARLAFQPYNPVYQGQYIAPFAQNNYVYQMQQPNGYYQDGVPQQAQMPAMAQNNQGSAPMPAASPAEPVQDAKTAAELKTIGATLENVGKGLEALSDNDQTLSENIGKVAETVATNNKATEARLDQVNQDMSAINERLAKGVSNITSAATKRNNGILKGFGCGAAALIVGAGGVAGLGAILNEKDRQEKVQHLDDGTQMGVFQRGAKGIEDFTSNTWMSFTNLLNGGTRTSTDAKTNNQSATNHEFSNENRQQEAKVSAEQKVNPAASSNAVEATNLNAVGAANSNAVAPANNANPSGVAAGQTLAQTTSAAPVVDTASEVSLPQGQTNGPVDNATPAAPTNTVTQTQHVQYEIAPGVNYVKTLQTNNTQKDSLYKGLLAYDSFNSKYTAEGNGRLVQDGDVYNLASLDATTLAYNFYNYLNNPEAMMQIYGGMIANGTQAEIDNLLNFVDKNGFEFLQQNSYLYYWTATESQDYSVLTNDRTQLDILDRYQNLITAINREFRASGGIIPAELSNQLFTMVFEDYMPLNADGVFDRENGTVKAKSWHPQTAGIVGNMIAAYSGVYAEGNIGTDLHYTLQNPTAEQIARGMTQLRIYHFNDRGIMDRDYNPNTMSMLDMIQNDGYNLACGQHFRNMIGEMLKYKTTGMNYLDAVAPLAQYNNQRTLEKTRADYDWLVRVRTQYAKNKGNLDFKMPGKGRSGGGFGGGSRVIDYYEGQDHTHTEEIITEDDILPGEHVDYQPIPGGTGPVLDDGTDAWENTVNQHFDDLVNGIITPEEFNQLVNDELDEMDLSDEVRDQINEQLQGIPEKAEEQRQENEKVDQEHSQKVDQEIDDLNAAEETARQERDEKDQTVGNENTSFEDAYLAWVTDPNRDPSKEPTPDNYNHVDPNTDPGHLQPGEEPSDYEIPEDEEVYTAGSTLAAPTVAPVTSTESQPVTAAPEISNSEFTDINYTSEGEQSSNVDVEGQEVYTVEATETAPAQEVQTTFVGEAPAVQSHETTTPATVQEVVSTKEAAPAVVREAAPTQEAAPAVVREAAPTQEAKTTFVGEAPAAQSRETTTPAVVQEVVSTKEDAPAVVHEAPAVQETAPAVQHEEQTTDVVEAEAEQTAFVKGYGRGMAA